MAYSYIFQPLFPVNWLVVTTCLSVTASGWASNQLEYPGSQLAWCNPGELTDQPWGSNGTCVYMQIQMHNMSIYYIIMCIYIYIIYIIYIIHTYVSMNLYIYIQHYEIEPATIGEFHSQLLSWYGRWEYILKNQMCGFSPMKLWGCQCFDLQTLGWGNAYG